MGNVTRTLAIYALRGLMLTLITLATAQAGDIDDFMRGMQRRMGIKPNEWRAIEIFITDHYAVINPAFTPLSADTSFRYMWNGPDLKINGKAATDEEQRQVRAEMFQKVQFDKLPQRTFGNGQNKVILFTAFDCPHCQKLEERLNRIGEKLNATVYVVPGTLSSKSQERKDAVRDFWCAPNPMESWVAWMTKRVAPPRAKSSCRYADTLGDAIHAMGITMTMSVTTPTLLAEDGSRIDTSAEDSILRALGSKRGN